MSEISLVTSTDSQRDGGALSVHGVTMHPIEFQLAFNATDIRMIYDLDGESEGQIGTDDAYTDPLSFESKLMLRAELDFGIDRNSESMGAYQFEIGSDGAAAQLAVLSVVAGAEDEQKLCALDWFKFNNRETLGINVTVPENEFSRMAEGLSQGWFDRLTLLIWDCAGVYCADDVNETRRLVVITRHMAEQLNQAAANGRGGAQGIGPVGGISLSCTRSFKLNATR